jgi:hypothetical protein
MNKKITKLKLNAAGCHTIHYNKFTQTIVALGYKNNVPVYMVDPKTYDLSLISEMEGH